MPNYTKHIIVYPTGLIVLNMGGGFYFCRTYTILKTYVH